MSGRHALRRRPRLGLRGRVAAALVALATAFVLVHPAPAQTEATWTDNEFGRGTFTALTVPPVTMTGCTVVPGALGILGSFTVTFQLPAGYVIANANYAVANNAAMTGATVVTPTVANPSTGVYTANFSTGLLGLLGTNVYLGIRITDTASTWTSTYKVAHGVVGLLATSSSCVLV